MATNFKVGENVQYINTASSRNKQIGIITNIVENDGDNFIELKFPDRTPIWASYESRIRKINLTGDEKLSALINKRITPEQYEGMM